MKVLTPFILIIMLYSCSENKEKLVINYPVTQVCDSADNYFGTQVADPYRWLENDTSPQVKAWVDAQNAVTNDYFSKIPFRNKMKQRLTELWNFPKMSAPFNKAGKIFFYKNDGLQNQSVLYIKESESSEAKVLLDPNTLSKDGTVSLSEIDISPDGKLLAYSISRGGSDWNEIYVKEIESGKLLSDKIEWVKFSGISFYQNGFFYSGYEKPGKGKELSQKNQFHKLYYHMLGESQDKDKVIIENRNDPYRSHYGNVSEDGKYLIVYESVANSLGNSIIVKDLSNPTNPFITLENSFQYKQGIINNIGTQFYISTNMNADKNKVVLVDIEKPQIENWKDIISERKDLIKSVNIANKKLIVNYLKDARSHIETYDLEGKFLGEVSLPVIGTVNTFNCQMNDTVAYYDFTSFNYPTTIFKYNLNNNVSKEYYKPEIKINTGDYEVSQVFYTSKDGTKIPMFIAYKKGIKLDGNNPTLLYGYGGFNISLTPSFSVSRLMWLENGGVFAMANLRGGGEYGNSWHVAGTKLQKQNVFDDLIAAAEYLISNKYTQSSKLAIQGGSNGGLLVGAVVNQRPELFKVALPAVGVMDMLRYHKFTIGWAWATDYGTSEDSTEFAYIYKYSPIHNVRSDVNYPAILVTTADHDDRVVPAHSFKYIAALQAKAKSENPMLIRIETQAGHGAGKPTDKMIDETTDIFSFILYNMDLSFGEK